MYNIIDSSLASPFACISYMPIYTARGSEAPVTALLIGLSAVDVFDAGGDMGVEVGTVFVIRFCRLSGTLKLGTYNRIQRAP